MCLIPCADKEVLTGVPVGLIPFQFNNSKYNTYNAISITLSLAAGPDGQLTSMDMIHLSPIPIEVKIHDIFFKQSSVNHISYYTLIMSIRLWNY